MSINEIVTNLETKEGLINLILQIIKECPNDADLGKTIRINVQSYLLENQ